MNRPEPRRSIGGRRPTALPAEEFGDHSVPLELEAEQAIPTAALTVDPDGISGDEVAGARLRVPALDELDLRRDGDGRPADHDAAAGCQLGAHAPQ